MNRSHTATGVCFFCGNPINPAGHHVYADVRHLYADGTTRVTDRNFHVPCFEKFIDLGGRPYNPSTGYEVLCHEEMQDCA